MHFFLRFFCSVQPSSENTFLQIEWKKEKKRHFFRFQQRTVSNRLLHIHSILLNDCGSFRFLSTLTVQVNMMNVINFHLLKTNRLLEFRLIQTETENKFTTNRIATHVNICTTVFGAAFYSSSMFFFFRCDWRGERDSLERIVKHTENAIQPSLFRNYTCICIKTIAILSTLAESFHMRSHWRFFLNLFGTFVSNRHI